MTTTTAKPGESLQRAGGATGEKARDLKSILEQRLPTITQLAGKYLNPERLLSLALVSTRKTPGLAACHTDTIIQAVMDSARLGLEPDGVEGAIIPYGKVAQFIPMVQGLVHVTLDEGTIVGIDMRRVREGDAFDMSEGSKPFIMHKPDIRLPSTAPVLGYYSIAHRLDGAGRASSTFEFMSLADVNDHRARFAKGRSGPWETSFDEMAKKTVYKRHSKKLPKGRRLRDAINHDNVVEMDLGDLELKATTKARTSVAGALAAAKGKPAPEPGPGDIDDHGDDGGNDGPPADVGLDLPFAIAMPAPVNGDRKPQLMHLVKAKEALGDGPAYRALTLLAKHRAGETVAPEDLDALDAIINRVEDAGGFAS